MSKKPLVPVIVSFIVFFVQLGCKEKTATELVEQKPIATEIQYAKGFTITKYPNYTVVEVASPWPNAEKTFSYALVPREKLATITFAKGSYDAIVPTPVKRIVVTSTTHIPALDALGALQTLIGFPNTDLVSSPSARARIESGHIKELGTNENINTEIVLEMAPELLMGFGINDTNKAYETVKRSGTAIVYNGDWTEKTPLGKAEWIKFFATFYQKEKVADSIFNTIVTNYEQAKTLAQKATDKPTVLTGGLYKDVWHVAGGESWMAQFLNDANADYLWGKNKQQGGIGLSFEAVFEKGKDAKFWFNPSLYSSYGELMAANPHYGQFRAFKTKNIFSNAIRKGPTGGLLFYELAPQRPDLVLKDLITIMHPGLLKGYELHFFMPLQ